MSYVYSVTVYPSSATITKGKWYYGAYASIASDCPECAEVEWYSNKPEIASVNKTTGYIYGVNTGTTRIYAEATDGSGKKDYITVTVAPPVSVTGVSVCPTSLTMNIGDTDCLCETVYPSNATNQTVTWCSSDDSVAEVNTYSGMVTAKKAGVATITACTVDGGYSASCVVTVNYCGGSNYRDVTKHNMVLQCDGYYECLKCGYRVKSPALEDKNILGEEDYYKVKACYLALPYYSQLEKESHKDERLKTNTLLAMIDDIRSKNVYNYKYAFSNSSGKCCREYTKENQNNWFSMPTTINKVDITDRNILMHNGFSDGLLNLIAGFFIPPRYSNLFTAITLETHYDTITALLSDLAKKAGYGELGIIVNLINFGASVNENIAVGDKLVKITFTVGAGIYVSEILFSGDGTLKAEYHKVE